MAEKQLREMSERAATRVEEFKVGLATSDEVMNGGPATWGEKWNGSLNLMELIAIFEETTGEEIPLDCGYDEAKYFAECALFGRPY